MTFKLIDLFAGPGGLGEGFSSLYNGASFKIALSAEMESSAHETLKLRSLFRKIKSAGDEKALRSYYAFCNSVAAPHPRESLRSAWKLACEEAQKLTLGDPLDNSTLDACIENHCLVSDKTIIIGGPPCQAYSIVGRSRNLGKKDYVAKDDARHYLYKQYLRILDKVKPIAFVMENVKGILSASVDETLIFHDILRDLTDPGKAMGTKGGVRYTIHSLVVDKAFKWDGDPAALDPRDFIVRAELLGLPQARHRVILLGIREDLNYDGKVLLKSTSAMSVEDAIRELPALRSRLSASDNPDSWYRAVVDSAEVLIKDARAQGLKPLSRRLKNQADSVPNDMDIGSLRYPRHGYEPTKNAFTKWVRDTNVKVWLNHESRAHMAKDLTRYFYAAVYAELYDRSPKGHEEFLLQGLAPNHANWKSGKFADRFRVQRCGQPSTTVTSHIAKDGHYFIHPDPTQCRSLTVREAARLQTFPDNYFFQGTRTQQYHQVGNAVPPLLALRIAEALDKILKNPNGRSKG